MKPTHVWIAFLTLGFLATPVARPADTEKAIKTGGNFEVEVVKDIAYCEGDDADPVKHKLDLYLPKGLMNFPVLFFVHGGSWSSGDRKLYGALGQGFASNGVGTVIISYRLSPKVQHPEHIKDVARAFAWTHRNIGKRGGNADQIFASGHSAGAHLVALLATDDTYLKAEKLAATNIRGVIGLSGPYAIVPGRIFEKAFGKDEDVVKNASPLKHVKEKLCPFCLIYAEKDFLTLDMVAELFCKELQKCKVEASATRMADRDHISIIRKAAASPDDPTTQAMLAFIAKHSELKLTDKPKPAQAGQ